MKKLLSAVLALLLILSISAPAFADMDSPYFREYEVRIINKDGAPLYLYNGEKEGTVIPYNTVVTVKGDSIEKGVKYFSVEYDGEWGFIKSSDTILLEDGVHYSEGVKLKHSRSYVVLEKGVRLYKGPSFGYEAVGEEIPVGTEFECHYALVDSSYVMWSYTTINGVGGWIHVFQYGSEATVASIIDKYVDFGNNIIVFDSGARLLDRPSAYEAQYVSEEIPVGTKLEFKYYYEQAKSIFVRVEYNGAIGWLEADAEYNGETANLVAIEKTAAFWVDSNGHPIYSKMGDTSSEVIGYVESGTLLKTVYSCRNTYEVEENGEWNYYNNSWYATEVNGQLGWINVTNDWEILYVWNIEQRIVSENNTNIYSECSTSSDVVATASKDSDILVLLWKDDMSYVDYEGKRGWVDHDKTEELYDSDDYFSYSKYQHSIKDYFSGRLTPEYLEAVRLGLEIKEEIEDVEAETGVNVSETTPGTTTGNETENGNDVEEEESEPFSSSQIIIFCAAGVAVLAITAIVILVLINKKRKS